MTRYINLPGIYNSGAGHWHSLWEKASPQFSRFEPQSWEQPDLQDWIAATERAVRAAEAPVILVAHSLSCLLVAHWAAQTTLKVAGAFLVSVPDPQGPRFPKVALDAGFQNFPAHPLPFASLMIGSSNDAYGTIGFMRHRSEQWKAPLINLGQLGHINEASGLGG